jgi:hypothetical protein
MEKESFRKEERKEGISTNITFMVQSYQRS